VFAFVRHPGWRKPLGLEKGFAVEKRLVVEALGLRS